MVGSAGPLDMHGQYLFSFVVISGEFSENHPVSMWSLTVNPSAFLGYPGPTADIDMNQEQVVLFLYKLDIRATFRSNVKIVLQVLTT
jgi:hypothetical protein